MGAKYDLWAINSEPDYYEEKRAHKEPSLPEKGPGRPAYGEALRIPVRRSRMDRDESKHQMLPPYDLRS
jgi:hypothetical protein